MHYNFFFSAWLPPLNSTAAKNAKPAALFGAALGAKWANGLFYFKKCLFMSVNTLCVHSGSGTLLPPPPTLRDRSWARESSTGTSRQLSDWTRWANDCPGSWNGHRCSCAFLPSASLYCPCFFFTQLCVAGSGVGVIIEFRPIYYERTETLSDFRFYSIVPPASGYVGKRISNHKLRGRAELFFPHTFCQSLCSKCFIVQTQFSLSRQWFPGSSKYSKNVPNNFKSYFHRSTLRSSAAGWTLWSTPSSPTSR